LHGSYSTSFPWLCCFWVCSAVRLSPRRLFGKPALAQLFGDYLGSDIRGLIHFSPPEDQRISVTAKLGVPRPETFAAAAAGGGGGGVGSGVKPVPAAGGSLTLRYQPDADTPYTFFDIKARTKGPASAAALRACFFDPSSKVAVHAELPVMATNYAGGTAPTAAALRLGAKYTSPTLSVGAVVNPAAGVLQNAFLVRCQCCQCLSPALALTGSCAVLCCAVLCCAVPWQQSRAVQRMTYAQRLSSPSPPAISTWVAPCLTPCAPPHSQVGRSGGLTYGVQTVPVLQLGGLFAGNALLDRPAWSAAARQCQLATSYAVAYEPQLGGTEGSPTGGRFTAAVSEHGTCSPAWWLVGMGSREGGWPEECLAACTERHAGTDSDSQISSRGS
jgi:hypothetical protein